VKFIPDEQQNNIDIPYFEESSKKYGIQGHGTNKTESQLLSEIASAIGRLGGMYQGADSGTFEFAEGEVRYGYSIRFNLAGHNGEIKLAALPIRSETPARIRQAKRQALFNLRETLEAQYMMVLLVPGSMPLMEHLSLPGGQPLAEKVATEYLGLNGSGKPRLVEIVE